MVLKPVSENCLHAMEIEKDFFKKPKFDKLNLDGYTNTKKLEQGLVILRQDCIDLTDTTTSFLDYIAPFMKAHFKAEPFLHEKTSDDDLLWNVFDWEDHEVASIATSYKDNIWTFVQNSRIMNEQIREMIYKCIKTPNQPDKCNENFLNLILHVLKNERPTALENDAQTIEELSLECHNFPHNWFPQDLSVDWTDSTKSWTDFSKKEKRVVKNWLVTGHKDTLSIANKSITQKIVKNILDQSEKDAFQSKYKTEIFDPMFEEDLLEDSNNVLKLRQILYDYRESLLFTDFATETCSAAMAGNIGEESFDIFNGVDRMIYSMKNQSLRQQFEKETNKSSNSAEETQNPEEVFNKKLTMIIKEHKKHVTVEMLEDKEFTKSEGEMFYKEKVFEVVSELETVLESVETDQTKRSVIQSEIISKIEEYED